MWEWLVVNGRLCIACVSVVLWFMNMIMTYECCDCCPMFTIYIFKIVQWSYRDRAVSIIYLYIVLKFELLNSPLYNYITTHLPKYSISLQSSAKWLLWSCGIFWRDSWVTWCTHLSQNLALVPHSNPACSSVVASSSRSSAIAVASGSSTAAETSGPTTSAGTSKTTTSRETASAGDKKTIGEELTETESDTDSSSHTAPVYDDESDMSLADLFDSSLPSPEL